MIHGREVGRFGAVASASCSTSAIAPAQFDEYIWFDESCAVDPLPGIPESHTIELDTEHPFAR